MANVLISEELFFKLFRYHCLHEFADQEQLDTLNREISVEIEEKLDSMSSRQLYKQSIHATTKEEREKARQEYLDKRGIPNDFRW